MKGRNRLWQKQFFEEMAVLMYGKGIILSPALLYQPKRKTSQSAYGGQRHKRYLQEHKRATYTTLLTSGKLNSYLANIDEQAEELFSRMVKQIAEREGVTEQLKAGNQLEWVQKMNSIRNRAVEIVNTELIYM